MRPSNLVLAGIGHNHPNASNGLADAARHSTSARICLRPNSSRCGASPGLTHRTGVC